MFPNCSFIKCIIIIVIKSSFKVLKYSTCRWSICDVFFIYVLVSYV